ncbi:hypothetical protein K469DRAFT_701684 [Zopfia rhizophila CBS 207.26]|uniref:Uncharacterized protein n=1 Tax=Zopfia rhizophila CBS 207.26 TaxID=1314779 RepID=A0A6A6EBA9_9PEZI|nr:hypothetical protein K469DRAFT_701684 [Zopfia rhizophila CBS 207.26]
MIDRGIRGSTRGISNEAVRLYEVARLPIGFLPTEYYRLAAAQAVPRRFYLRSNSIKH